MILLKTSHPASDPDISFAATAHYDALSSAPPCTLFAGQALVDDQRSGS
ncbi:MAG: hypothetical protein WBG17_02085 [Burkholderiaceae bacterium]